MLAGRSVCLGCRGKSQSAINRTKKTATNVVAGAARAISPVDEIVGLDIIEAGVVLRKSQLNVTSLSTTSADYATEES